MPVPLFFLLLFPFLLSSLLLSLWGFSCVSLKIWLLVSCGRQLVGSGSGMVCVNAEFTVWLTVQIWFWLHVCFLSVSFLFFFLHLPSIFSS